MREHELLGQLSSLHEMMVQLFESLTEEECYSQFHPMLAPLAWYLGRGMYTETYWLREVVQGDSEMTARVRVIFIPGVLPDREQWKRLPPRDHLLNWALELQDENVMRLANPGALPQHPLLTSGRLLHFIVQSQSEIYEQMLQVLNERRLQMNKSYQVEKPLNGIAPTADHIGVSQGHYRIGASNDPAAFDNEQPDQLVQLSNFRIDRQPATNAAFLAFIEAGGYDNREYWSDAGWQWDREGHTHPHHWRQDNRQNWYGIGFNGPFDLVPEDPVMGVTHHEATAYANWISTLGGELSGAALQHEYQWEVAVRTKVIKHFGRGWEWCSNIFEPYADYAATNYQEAKTTTFDNRHYTLRGGSLHTQRALRRASYRNNALPETDYLFSGIRLIYPPKQEN